MQFDRSLPMTPIDTPSVRAVVHDAPVSDGRPVSKLEAAEFAQYFTHQTLIDGLRAALVETDEGDALAATLSGGKHAGRGVLLAQALVTTSNWPDLANDLAGLTTVRELTGKLAVSRGGHALACHLVEYAEARDSLLAMLGCHNGRALVQHIIGTTELRGLHLRLLLSDAGRDLARTLIGNGVGETMARVVQTKIHHGIHSRLDLARDLVETPVRRELVRDLAESDMIQNLHRERRVLRHEDFDHVPSTLEDVVVTALLAAMVAPLVVVVGAVTFLGAALMRVDEGPRMDPMYQHIQWIISNEP